jgi:peptidoglycan/LPS O-acetylase OafA/YrhL
MAGAVALLVLGAPFGILLNRTLLGGVLRSTALNIFFAGGLGSLLVIGSSNLKWIVQRPILQFFGRISYGLYLFHMLAFDFAGHLLGLLVRNAEQIVPKNFPLMCLRFTIAATLATTVAALSRKYFEERFLVLKERWASPAENRRTITTASFDSAVTLSAAAK